jgi:quinol---cytochrome c reductase iron-sulfur subunit
MTHRTDPGDGAPMADDVASILEDGGHKPPNMRAYRAALVSFSIAIVGGIAAAIGYASDNTGDLLGLGLAAALTGIGFGLVCWAKFLDFDEHAVQHREPLVVPPAQHEELHEELQTTGSVLGRRKLLLGLLGGAFVSMLVGFVGPIGSLGPKPRGERQKTAWAPGSRLVTLDGSPIEAAGTTYDQLVTVFPEGHVGVDDSQVVLLRMPPDVLTQRTIDGGALDGWVAYSKICTHAGCSVGLFGVDNRPPDTLRQLVCPCHQSVFDPVDAAEPVGGPAPRRLPQLALAVDDDGYLVAQSGFEVVVGPLAWNEA